MQKLCLKKAKHPPVRFRKIRQGIIRLYGDFLRVKDFLHLPDRLLLGKKMVKWLHGRNRLGHSIFPHIVVLKRSLINTLPGGTGGVIMPDIPFPYKNPARIGFPVSGNHIAQTVR